MPLFEHDQGTRNFNDRYPVYGGRVEELNAALDQARCSERRLLAQYEVTRVLAESVTLREAGQNILGAIGKTLNWKLGMLWSVDSKTNLLYFVDLWHAFTVDASAFCEGSRNLTFHRGEGLIGQVWASGLPTWIPDVGRTPGFCRAPVAARVGVGLHGWCGFPVCKGDRLYGVIEFFTDEIREVEEDVLQMMADIGIKIGQFVDRREAEEELRRVEMRLLEEARLADVARVLGDISHDIKNMLTPVILGASLLEEELNESFAQLSVPRVSVAARSRDLTKELIEMIQHGSRRVQERVGELADSVKGLRRPTQFSPCHMGQVISSVYGILRIPAAERGIVLQVSHLDTLPVIQADESRLFNAFYNLVNNAISEVPPGGTITVQGAVEPGGTAITLSVMDTGRGMTREVQESLFTYRAISHKVAGTGLGTKIVKDVVDAHGGHITVESRLGMGTSFHLTLPVEYVVSVPANVG
ncbi:MAG: GAF domain-containing sensor histidine kinase [Nitrospira sp.]|nr:GAF domain-containing sensor histidine kinase [Nitrospira sp.]MDR4489204.1 GAF domain-containing sensor histidine kinase [Nitrospirales bacterium]